MSRTIKLLVVAVVIVFGTVMGHTLGDWVLAQGEVPPCVAHDPLTWHTLYDSVLDCHYDHTHGDDPHLVDGVFGTDAFTWLGGEVEYPWAVPGEVHGGQRWLVRADLGCYSRYGMECVTDLRLLYNGVVSGDGAVERWHSFWLEARVCDEDNPTDCGVVRTGGWPDFGDLCISGVPVDLGDGADLDCTQRLRNHSPPGAFDTWATWSGRSSQVGINLIWSDAWGPVDPVDPYNLILVCPDADCVNNGSQVNILNLGVTTHQDLVGHTDRFGTVVECDTVGLDCIPFETVYIPGYGGYRDSAHGIGKIDYDTSPPGEWWIEYPYPLVQPTPTPSATATDTPTESATVAPSDTATVTWTPSSTWTPTDTPTATSSATSTDTATPSDTPTSTPCGTCAPCPTGTPCPTDEPCPTGTPCPSCPTPTVTATMCWPTLEPGGQYCPNRPHTRAEFAQLALLCKHGPGYLPPTPVAEDTCFDVVGHPMESWVTQAQVEGLAEVCIDGNFRPNDWGERDDMSPIMAWCLGLVTETPLAAVPVPTVSRGWYVVSGITPLAGMLVGTLLYYRYRRRRR